MGSHDPRYLTLGDDATAPQHCGHALSLAPDNSLPADVRIEPLAHAGSLRGV